MKCFQILNDEVLIIDGDKEYKDTKIHFVADGGSLDAIKVYTKDDKPEEVEMVPNTVIYDDVQRHCVVNEGWYQYPNVALDAYIAAIDTYLNAKAEREYVPPVPPTFEELKEAKIKEASALFAKRRDAIRFIDLPSGKNYGFDCASEDITNFMAAYTPLMIEKSGSTGYKVWLNQTTKGLVTLDYADMKYTYNTVRTSQLEAYTWYEAIKLQFNACTTKEELDNITLE